MHAGGFTQSIIETCSGPVSSIQDQCLHLCRSLSVGSRSSCHHSGDLEHPDAVVTKGDQHS
jgi:hypothetical protein